MPGAPVWYVRGEGRAAVLEAARKCYIERAEEWTCVQAQRLRIEPADVLRAIACGFLPERTGALSGPSALLAEMAGRSTVPRDPRVLRSLRRLRGWWAPDRGIGA